MTWFLLLFQSHNFELSDRILVMFVKSVYLTALTLYAAFVGVILVYFEANILWVMLMLTLLPTALFWYLEKLNTRIIPIILVIAFTATLFFETFAYLNGIWYELSPLSSRLFGLIPVEAFIAGFAHWLFFIVVYEYFFDDRKTSRKKTLPFLHYFLAGTASLIAFSLAYVYLFSATFFTFPFALMIVLGFVVFITAIIIFQTKWIRVMPKVLVFALCLLPFSLVYEYVSLQNDLRFFANVNEYIYSFNFLGMSLPVEELLFVFLVPFWMAALYELYLDDGR